MPIERKELDARREALEAEIALAEGELQTAREAVQVKESALDQLNGSLAEVDFWLNKLPERESEDYPRLGQKP